MAISQQLCVIAHFAFHKGRAGTTSYAVKENTGEDRGVLGTRQYPVISIELVLGAHPSGLQQSAPELTLSEKIRPNPQ